MLISQFDIIKYKVNGSQVISLYHFHANFLSPLTRFLIFSLQLSAIYASIYLSSATYCSVKVDAVQIKEGKK